MKIVIVCDSFKESLSAIDVAHHVEAGFRAVYPDAHYIRLPAADGGEGTVEALVTATKGRIRTRVVTGPMGEPVDAFYGITGDGGTAVIEMAAAAGLTLVPRALRNPLHTTSRGVGELMLDALDQGCRHFIIGLGGSATNDGGAGLAQAMGVSFRDAHGRELPDGGASLADLAVIDLTRLEPRLTECVIEVACDVDNPLTGPKGASAIFGPQKGATPEMVLQLDASLLHYGRCLEHVLGRRILDVPGTGAAGGIGATAIAFLGATLGSGVDIVMRALGLDEIVSDADLVITGEGRIDGQTIHGKTPIGVARIAKSHGKPVIAIAGSLGPGAEEVHAHGIDAIFSVLRRPCSLEQALDEAADNVRMTARNIAAVSRVLVSGSMAAH
jgi:glycerate 2-kinase